MTIVKEIRNDLAEATIEDLLRPAEPPAPGTRRSAPDPQKLERSRQRLEILLKVTELLSEPGAPDQLPDLAVALLQKTLGVERAVLLIKNYGTGELDVRASRSSVPTEGRQFSRHIANHVLEKGVAVLSIDAREDARFEAAASIAQQSIRASMCAPLRGRRGSFGVLYADNVKSSDIFGEEELRFLSAFANQAAIALENAFLQQQIAEEARARERELTRLVEERTRSLHDALVEAERHRDIAEKASEMALEASKAKSRFLANMSHELRTPLNGIIGYAEILEEEANEEGAQARIGDLKKIVGAARHLLALINDILDLSKIEAGKMTLLLHDFDLGFVVRETASLVAPLVERKANRLEVVCDQDLGSMYADETRVRQVLYNLLSNASKFTDHGVIRLEVFRHQMDGQSWISAKVADSGIGMTADQLGKLFTAFVQAEGAATSRKFGGTGLGLAISREFCRLMGGDIRVESAPGEGSTFTMDLPLRVTAPPPTAD